MRFDALIALLIFLPMGAAAQNIGHICALLMGLKQGIKPVRLKEYFKLHGLHTLLASSFPLLLGISTALNAKNPASASLALSYLGWVLMPVWIYLSQKSPVPDYRRYLRVLAGVALCFGIVSLSQMLFPWRVLGTSFVSDVGRARGFYSHPLSFAYVLLWFWPLACFRILRAPRERESWWLFGGIALSLYASQSRTVQCGSLIVLSYFVWTTLRGVWRLRLSLLIGLGTLSVLFTDNSLSQRVRATFSAQGLDRLQDRYPDDRLAFWDAHWQMIKERPLIGHGVKLDEYYRAPYYEELGLKDFKKPYEAHNAYIQLAAEVGFLGLALWLSWLILECRLALRLDRLHPEAPVLFPTLMLFAFTALTQNSFQDATVRFGIGIFGAILVLLRRVQARPAPMI